MINIVAVGDIMPGGLLHGTDRKVVSDAVHELLEQGDIRVGTLECAIGNEPVFIEEKMKRYGDVIYAPDTDLKRLVDLRINLVSLANNHFFDLKETGAQHAISMLDELGIQHCGAGSSIYEAQKPSVFTIGNKRIAFLAFCDYHSYMGWIPFATENSAGVNPMYDDYVIEEIIKNKKKYDFVVVLAHWGREHTFETTTWCYRLARQMVKAGADLILGSHPHRVQPVISWHNKSIVFSMGNFLFPDRLIAPPLRSTYYSDKTVDTKVLPVTYKYPSVEEITYKKWPPLARYGMIVSSSISGCSVKSHSQLTYLGEDNMLDVMEESSTIERALRKYGFLLKYTPYRFTIYIMRKIVSGRRAMKRALLELNPVHKKHQGGATMESIK